MKVLKFYADWCAPCKALSQLIESAGDKITVQIEEIDIDSNMERAIQYGVRSVPVMVVVDDDGEELRRHNGTLSEAALIDFLEK